MIRKETAAWLVTQMLIVSESDWTTFSDRCLTNNVEQTFVLKIQSFNLDLDFGWQRNLKLHSNLEMISKTTY